MKSLPYTYTTLRYVHDTATEEFLNVGIVLLSAEGRFAGFRLRKTTGRLSRAFPGFDRTHYRTMIGHLENRLAGIAEQVRGLPFEKNPQDARTMATRVLREDDSAFQWSPPGSGVSPDLRQTLADTYARLVERHEVAHHPDSRSDEDIWRIFSEPLRANGGLQKMRPRTIRTSDERIEFRHAWQNGKWHCLEPLSFDLKESSRIQGKAHLWLGGLTSARSEADDLQVYFLVGRPQREELGEAYKGALRILAKVPVAHRIVEEHEVANFLESLAPVLPGAGSDDEDEEVVPPIAPG